MSKLPIRNQRHLSKSAPWGNLWSGMDDFFDHFNQWPFHKTQSGGSGMQNELNMLPSVDVSESKKAYKITAELPGMSTEDIKVDLSDGVLSLSGEKKSEKESDEENYHISERSYGFFKRNFALPPDVEPDSIEADFKKGVLIVTLPKNANAQEKQRKIEVNKID